MSGKWNSHRCLTSHPPLLSLIPRFFLWQGPGCWSTTARRGTRTVLCVTAVTSRSVPRPSSRIKTTTTVCRATRAGLLLSAATVKRWAGPHVPHDVKHFRCLYHARVIFNTKYQAGTEPQLKLSLAAGFTKLLVRYHYKRSVCVLQALTKGGVTYKDEVWHKECFLCTGCKAPLAGQPFTSQGESPYCVKCFSSLYAKKCAGCNTAITGQCCRSDNGGICCCSWIFLSGSGVTWLSVSQQPGDLGSDSSSVVSFLPFFSKELLDNRSQAVSCFASWMLFKWVSLTETDSLSGGYYWGKMTLRACVNI